MSATMSRQEVVDLVRDQLSEIMEIDPGKIAEQDFFVEDLNADSLALIELVEALEASLKDSMPGFRIEDEELEKMQRVSDAVDYICARTGAN